MVLQEKRPSICLRVSGPLRFVLISQLHVAARLDAGGNDVLYCEGSPDLVKHLLVDVYPSLASVCPEHCG